MEHPPELVNPSVSVEYGPTAPGGSPAGFHEHRLGEYWRAVPPGGDTMKDRIGPYRAEAVDPDIWVVIEPVAKEWVAIAAASDPVSAPRLLTPLSQLLAWCHVQGLALVPEVVLHVDTIEQFIREELKRRPPGSAATVRSYLRTVGERVLGPESNPLRQRLLATSEPERPYTDVEVADVLGAVKGLSTEFRRVNTLVVISVGLGAGLGNSDLAGLVGTDITHTGSVVAIDIKVGRRPRRTVVTEEWEEMVLRRSREVGERPMFCPDRHKPQVKDIPNFMDRVRFPGLAELGLQRLRVTWIVRQLTAGVPAQVVAAAAGVGPNQISRYFRFVPEMAGPEADRLLRNGPDR